MQREEPAYSIWEETLVLNWLFHSILKNNDTFATDYFVLRAFIAILLASLFLMQSASKLFIVANYEFNKAYISKNLCENKNKPNLHCNGKCHLKKQLQKEDKKENQNPNNLKEKIELQFFKETNSRLNVIETPMVEQINSIYLLGNYNQHLLSIFHPPRV